RRRRGGARRGRRLALRDRRMKIAAVEVRPERTPIAVPYRIAGRTFDTAEIVTVTIRAASGRGGDGAAPPAAPPTGDDCDSASRALAERISPALRGRSAEDLDGALAAAAEAAQGAMSALAAADVALHDLRARTLGAPLVRFLGGPRRRLVTSVTV